MIIPVRCFTCGKVYSSCITLILYTCARRFISYPNDLLISSRIIVFQVIGNKWDTYLDLLQSDYTEGSVVLSTYLAFFVNDYIEMCDCSVFFFCAVNVNLLLSTDKTVWFSLFNTSVLFETWNLCIHLFSYLEYVLKYIKSWSHLTIPSFLDTNLWFWKEKRSCLNH